MYREFKKEFSDRPKFDEARFDEAHPKLLEYFFDEGQLITSSQQDTSLGESTNHVYHIDGSTAKITAIRRYSHSPIQSIIKVELYSSTEIDRNLATKVAEFF